MSEPTRVAILICTCDRPAFLGGLLRALVREVSEIRCAITSIVVIDSGSSSVLHLVKGFQPSLPIYYQEIGSRGIVFARNASVRAALEFDPDVLVFIDDDEVPEEGWLDSLVSHLLDEGLDIVTGPVGPILECGAPSWAYEFFSKSGHTLCTSNLALSRSALPRDERYWFNALFNETGGEDNEFLGRLVSAGAKHGVAPQARVVEHIPAERMTLSYVIRHGLRDGVVAAQKLILSDSFATRRVLRCIYLVLQKLGYALFHLLCSIFKHRQLILVIDDVSFVVGLICRLLGRSFVFYGLPH